MPSLKLKLSDREREVVKLLGDDLYTTEEVARIFKTSVHRISAIERRVWSVENLHLLARQLHAQDAAIYASVVVQPARS